MSLRVRLLAVMLAVLAGGLAVADVATYASLQRFLTRRVDQQLAATRFPAAGRLMRQLNPPDSGETRRRFAPSVGRSSLDIAPAGTYAELRDGTGTKLASMTIGFGEQAAIEPRLPKQTTPPLRRGQRRLFTAPARKGSTDYRVLAEASPESDTVLVLAIPLREVTSTLHRLVFVEVLVTGGVLALVVVIALWLVRLSLRPLDKMTLTAGEIAAGNLSARVEDDDDHSEVGRLGRALNAMLHQIEQAFSARQRSEDQLRQSEERLRRFVADASHELRTPLTSIRGHSELFRRGADADPVALAQSMRRIEEEAARMGVLVDDLLLLARLDEGRPPERERVDLTKIVQDAVTDARASEPDRTIELRDGADVIVLGDTARLQQLVANLLANARVHTPPSAAVRVEIRSEGAEVVLVVADDGPGMTPEQASRVFERFYRADASRARRRGGTGLGLSIVTAVAEAHGGSVVVDTAPDAGATFTVRLPRDGAAQP
jgi:two-component system OmpR family sensor kinase